MTSIKLRLLQNRMHCSRRFFGVVCESKEGIENEPRLILKMLDSLRIDKCF
jgi:hypothetical protein